MEHQQMALTSKYPFLSNSVATTGASFSRINCPRPGVSMLVLRDPAEVKNISNPEIRSLVQERFKQIAGDEPFDWQRHGNIFVLEPSDTAAEVEALSGCPILNDVFGEFAFGDPGFLPAAEVMEEGASWYELGFVLNDDGFTVIIFVPKNDGIDAELLAMCAEFSTPAKAEVPRLLEPPAKYRIS